jgi:ABC-type phosphate/phosphonate transport system permease subunit
MKKEKEKELKPTPAFKDKNSNEEDEFLVKLTNSFVIAFFITLCIKIIQYILCFFSQNQHSDEL